MIQKRPVHGDSRTVENYGTKRESDRRFKYWEDL